MALAVIYAGTVADLRGDDYLQVRSAMRCGDRVEQAHPPFPAGERTMQRSSSSAPTRRFVDSFGFVGDGFRPGRPTLLM